jgi:hypothetical protein
MKHDGTESGVYVVAVRAPAAGCQVNFDITLKRGIRADLDNCLAEVRSGLVVGKTGVQHSQRAAVGQGQLVTQNPLVSPHCLEQAFGWLTFA